MSSISDEAQNLPSSILLKNLSSYKRNGRNNQQIFEIKNDQNFKIKLSNFELIPKKIRIRPGTTINVEICENKNIYATHIYSNTAERSFYLSIEELDVQSNKLHKGDVFRYFFLEEGVYELKVN
jgi:hypothetical protein